MAIIFIDSFESNDFSVWTSNYGGCSVVNSPKYSGNFAMEATDSAQQIAIKTGLNTATAFFRAYVYMPALPTAGNYVKVMMMYDTGSSDEVGAIIYNDGGTLKWGLGKFSGNTYVAGTISATTWYCVEVQRTVGAGTGIAKLYVNGELLISATAETFNNNSDELHVCIDFASAAVTVNIDCVVVADAYIGTALLSEELHHGVRFTRFRDVGH
jgi:hypothetical protein